MINRNILAFFIFCFLYSVHATGQIHIAIGDFENRSDWMYLDSWAKKIPDYLQNELSRYQDIELVERHQLSAILNEQALSMSGLTDSSKVQEVGKLISAQYIVTGIIDKEDDCLRIDAKVINTTTGKVVSEKVQSKDKSHLNEMVAMLGNNLIFQLNGQGHYQSRVKIKKFPTYIFLCTTLASGITTGLLHNAYQERWNDYHAVSQSDKIEKTYDSANRFYKSRNIFIGVTSASLTATIFCWLYNLSSDEIFASEPIFMPYAHYQTGETTIGLQINF